MLISDVSPSLEIVEKLSHIYNKIFIFDHHETLLKNLQDWQKSPENVHLFYSNHHSASWVLLGFFNKYLMKIQSIVEKNFFNDILQKLKYIDINDTSIIEDQNTC